MKKKGFTLIELLAVVIVLAVIALVAVPVVIDVIEDARSSANKSSVYGMIDAAKMYYSESMLDENKKLNVEKLNDIYEYVTLNGEKPEGGKLYVNEQGQVAVQVVINNTCYLKDFIGNLQETKEYTECDLGIVGTDENKPEIELIVNTNPQYGEWYNEEVYVNIRDVNEIKTGIPTIEFILKDTESGILSYKWCIGLECNPNNESEDLNKTLVLTDSKETQVCVIAKDKSLKESEKVCTNSIKQDTQNPTITGVEDITIQVNGTYNLDENVKIEDTISGVESETSYEYKIYDENEIETTIDTTKTGKYKVVYTFKDKAGNEYSKTRKLEISATAPTIEFKVEEGILNSSNWAKEDFQVTINVTDNTGHGIKEFKVCTANSDRCEPTNGSTITNSTTATRDIMLEGKNIICVQATDNYNQTSETKCSDVYNLDKTLPTVTYSILGGTYNEYKTIRVTPSDTNYDYMHIEVYKKIDGVIYSVNEKSKHDILDSYFDIELDSDETWYIYTMVYDAAGNIQNQEPNNINNFYYQAYIIDTTDPTIELSKETYFEGFDNWTYEGGAYEQDGIVYLPQATGSYAYAPYYLVNKEKWNVSFDVKSSDGNEIGGAHAGATYYNSNFESFTSNNGYSENGWATSTSQEWNHFPTASSGFGMDVEYILWFFITDKHYSTGPIEIKNFKIHGQLYNDFYNINLLNKSEDIEIIKYAKGEYDKSYFVSNGAEVTTDTIRVTENGTYTVYAKDTAGNEVIKTITIDKIDKTVPTIIAKSTTNKIKLGDNNNITNYFEVQANGISPITKTTCINKTDNKTITDTSTLTAGTHEIECKVLKANNKTSVATTKISVMDYGVTTSSSYDALYSGIDSGSLVTSNYLIDGNAKCCGNMMNANEFLNFQRFHNGPAGTSVESVTYNQDYINAGDNFYSLEKTTDINRWVQLYIHGGYNTYSVEIGNLKLKFNDGNEYTLEESVQNGYIEPLVIISAYASEEVWLFKNSFNLYNGGTTDSSDYGNLNIIFKITSKSKMIGFNLNSSKSFGRDYADGFHVYQFDENFEISTKPW